MEWTEILNIILGGTSVVAIVGLIVYRKQNKRIKDNEVKASDVETQRQQIGPLKLKRHVGNLQTRND